MRLALGTAQLGMDYGISNPAGRPSRAAFEKVLHRAAELGIRTLDTAALYGDAESRLGEHAPLVEGFAIVTKTCRIATPAITTADADRVRETFEQSLRRLRRDRVEGLLVHHAPDLLADGGERIWNVLLSAREEGKARHIGVSVYCPEHAGRILDRFGIDLIQLPVNLLDRRFQRSGTLRRLADGGVRVYARSPFLQGLLLLDPNHLHSHFDPVRECLRRFHQQARGHRLTAVEATIGYVCTVPLISEVVVGVTSARQLSECISAMKSRPRMNYGGYGCEDVRIVEPFRWELA